MKTNRLRPTLATALMIVMTCMLVSPTLLAADGGTDKGTTTQKQLPNAKATVLASVKNRNTKDDFTTEELEQMRTALLDLLDANQTLSSMVHPQGETKGSSKANANDFDEARVNIQQMSTKDLSTLRKALDPTKMQEKLANSQRVLSKFKDGQTTRSSSVTPNSAGLPGINAYCGAPVSTAVIIAADVVYFTAEAVRDIAQDGCNQVLVVLGEGGNGRAACLITDAIYIIAKAVNQGIHFCDDDYNQAVTQANYDRLGHIHDDLDASVANDNTNEATIVSNDNANTLTLDTHATTNTTNIVNNDNANRVTIVNNDNANALALTTLVNAALTQIITNANANKDEVKNLLLRTQIESDLSSTDGAAFVALYETPSNVCFPSLNALGLPQPGVPSSVTQCGLLDLVRSIVSQTIANVGAGTNAQSYFAIGDSQRAMGKYKAAYASYRLAFKAAGK